jgi:hypothetical protein
MEQRVLQFEYQQSLVQESERSGWSERFSVSVRILSEAITSGWYRQQFAHRGNDFIILLAIAMHARPLKGDDLKMLVNLHMATPEDEGRLYARVSDVALAAELGISRMTVARGTQRLAKEKSLNMVELPEKQIAYRDSHGRFNGKKVYLLAGDIQSRFLEKNVEKLNHAVKRSMVDGFHETKRCMGGSKLNMNKRNEEEDEEVFLPFFQEIFPYFARKKGDLEYHPTIKEQIALEKLVRDGFCLEQIITGIDLAFIRPSRPRYFTHCAAIVRDLVRLQQEIRKPDANQVITGKPEALGDTGQQQGAQGEVIEAELAEAIEVYRSSGREICDDLLTRFRLIVKRCDQAAKSAGSHGGEWLAAALTRALGVAQPQNLLNYADAVINDWITNGHRESTEAVVGKSAPVKRSSRIRNREPAIHEGIREFLKRHGGFPDGNGN